VRLLKDAGALFTLGKHAALERQFLMTADDEKAPFIQTIDNL
jgi:hypothetical protein